MIPREVRALFEKLEPVQGESIRALKLEYQADPSSRPEVEMLLSHIAAQFLGDPPIGVPPKLRANGSYRLADVMAGDQVWDRFGLNEPEWIQHVGVFGRSGSGKTNACFSVLQRFMEQKKPFLVFDWKRNYRDLLRRQEFSGLKVFSVGRNVAPFGFNPLLPPPGTELQVFLKKLIEIMMHVYWLGDGVAYLLQKAIDEVYQEKGAYENRATSFPTLFDVRDWLRAYKSKGRESQWMDSTRRVIETLCFGQVGRVVQTRSNSGFERMLGLPVVLELDSLSNSDKTFLIECILLWLYHKRMNETGRETFKHAVVIEEAHHVLLKRKESRETAMDIIFREIRELGEAIVFLDQHPSLVSIPSLGNSYCTIAMNLKHGSDVSALGKAMLLDEDEQEFLGQAPVGQALVKLQDRWHKPFRVRFPHVAVQKGSVSDSDLKGQDLTDFAIASEVSPFPARREEVPVVPAPDNIDELERELLGDVMDAPTAGIKERMKRLGTSTRKLYFLLSSLTAKGLVVVDSISTSKGRIKVVRLTGKGKAAVGIDEGSQRHESAGHWYWKMKIAEQLLAKGHTVEVEKDGADIAFQKDGKRIAVEIETGKSDVEGNIKRDLQRGFDEVIVLWVGRTPVRFEDPKVSSIRVSDFQSEWIGP